jgi:serine/threonine-protein kinase RIO1
MVTMTTYFDPGRGRWMTGARKATNAEVRAARRAAFAHGPIPCPIDSTTVVLVNERAFVKLDKDGRAFGLTDTKYGR